MADEVPLLMRLERAVEGRFRAPMLAALQAEVDGVDRGLSGAAPHCADCGRAMQARGRKHGSFITRFGTVETRAAIYRCRPCRRQTRPLLTHLGAEAGCVSGSLARLLALLGVVVPYQLMGDADRIFERLWAKLCELGWLSPATVIVIVGDGAEWIWKRAQLFPQRCEILDFWHAVEYAWDFARVRYGEDATVAAQWVHRLADDLRAGRVAAVIARLQAMRVRTPEQREALDAVIKYYDDNRTRMQYDEYLRRGYGIGSGAVESAHKQVVPARLRQAGMRWSELGAQRLLALRVLLLNDQWALLDRLAMRRRAA
ncbi:MAG TPA: hypothetical protein VGQ83_28420 [Polyangia bacterium]